MQRPSTQTPRSSCKAPARGSEAGRRGHGDPMTAPPDVREAGPVTGGPRIDAIDVLRGAALPGILLMNVPSFAMPSAAYFNPTACERPPLRRTLAPEPSR